MFEINQYGDFSSLLLRLVIAAIFIYHALPKLTSPRAMAGGISWPKEAVLTLGIVEFASSLCMIFGVYVRVAALLLSVVMVGAIYMKTMKWRVPFSTMSQTGWEFDLILLASNLLILVNGGGALAIQ